MNKILYILLFIFSFNTTVNAQEDKIGAMKTKNGTLLYFNTETSFTIDMDGNVKLEQFPFITVDDKLFQFIQNTVEKNSKSLEENLKGYMDWEIKYLNEQLPEKITTQSELIVSENDTLNLWYYNIPIIKDTPKDVTPYKRTFYLDWKKDDFMYRLTFPSYSGDVNEAKLFLVNLKNHFRYYTKTIDPEKLYDNIEKGQNYYEE